MSNNTKPITVYFHGGPADALWMELSPPEGANDALVLYRPLGGSQSYAYRYEVDEQTGQPKLMFVSAWTPELN